jgi:F-type H+-transporting ATPase subunit b
MPQINQLSTVFNSQLFWLLVVFGIIYFVIARTMVPKVRSVMDGRSERIAKEIARAEAARAVAEEAQEAWALRLEKSRAEAAAVAQEARRAAARENEAMVNAAVAKINLKVEAAERNIRKAAADIRVEMMGVAADAAQDLVERLTGIRVAKEEALDAVAAELELVAGKSVDRVDVRPAVRSPRADRRRVVEKVR